MDRRQFLYVGILIVVACMGFALICAFSLIFYLLRKTRQQRQMLKLHQGYARLNQISKFSTPVPPGENAHLPQPAMFQRFVQPAEQWGMQLIMI